MRYMLEDILEVIIPLLSFGALIYVVILFGKACYKKLITAITGNSEGKFTYEQKKNILNIIKIFVGAQVISLLFYITPTINENIKIFLSLLIVFGSFIGMFLLNERTGNSSVCRTLIFLGQEFFGMTMILLMVNKGIGYSLNNILAIWTVFNFFIYKKFNKTENKIFFMGTLLTLICSLFINYANEVDTAFGVIVLLIVSIFIQIFADEENLFVKITHNFILTVVGFMILTMVGNDSIEQGIIFMTTLIYMASTAVLRLILNKVNIKAFLTYIPCLVMLLLIEIEISFIGFIAVFNFLVTIWLTSEKSLYKKLLCAFIMLLTTGFDLTAHMVIDRTFGSMIYLGSLIFVCTYVFEPVASKYLAEGEDSNEE